MPASSFKAVVAEPRRPRVDSEVVEVRNRVRRLVLVITGHRASLRFESPPRSVVTVSIVFSPARRVRIVAEGQHGSTDGVDQTGRGLGISGAGAQADVPRGDDDRRRGG